jgi:hypothetical protein
VTQKWPLVRFAYFRTPTIAESTKNESRTPLMASGDQRCRPHTLTLSSVGALRPIRQTINRRMIVTLVKHNQILIERILA